MTFFVNVVSFVILHNKEANKLRHVLLLLTEIQKMDYQFTKLFQKQACEGCKQTQKAFKNSEAQL